MIPEDLLKILACPKCRGEIKLDESLGGLVCENCHLFYEVREGIPIMLLDEARPLEEVKKEKGQS